MGRSLSLILLASLASCGVHMEMDTPEGFLQLQDDASGIRATSPDGARLVVREFDEANEGSLEFWAEALEHDYERERGYVREHRDEVEDATGRRGIVWRYRVHAEGGPHGYLVALFVNERRIRVLEMVAPREVFDARVEAVEASIATMR